MLGSVSPANSVSLRPVGTEEAQTLADIHAECFPNYWDRAAFTDFFAVAGTFAYLAESGGEPVGMVVIRPQFDQADILTLAVRQPFRRAGLARRMLDAALQKAQEMGAARLFLEVEEGNEAAVKLYENAGFSHAGRRKLYYRQINGTYTDALVMQKKLV